jgi:hypothetical protein
MSAPAGLPFRTTRNVAAGHAMTSREFFVSMRGTNTSDE